MCQAERYSELELLLGMTPPSGQLGMTLKSSDGTVKVKVASAFAQGVGFQTGDVVVAVDEHPVRTCQEFLQAWTSARAHIDKVPVQFRVRRMGFDSFIPNAEAESSDADADTVSLDFSTFLEEDC
jgi:hypothetical protein